MTRYPKLRVVHTRHDPHEAIVMGDEPVTIGLTLIFLLAKTERPPMRWPTCSPPRPNSSPCWRRRTARGAAHSPITIQSTAVIWSNGLPHGSPKFARRLWEPKERGHD
jgi:hypothetical protein